MRLVAPWDPGLAALPPIELELTWAAAVPALVMMDPDVQDAGGAHPGLYLHVVTGAAGPVGSYVGKHEVSVRERQFEHLEAYMAGRYNVLDASGSVVHRAGQVASSALASLVDVQLNRTVIYAGVLGGCPPNHFAHLLEAAESLLLHAPRRVLLPNHRLLNSRPGSGKFQAFRRFAVRHLGDPGPHQLLGAATVWDASTRVIDCT